MPTTQHRPHGAYAGPVFGTLDGKTEDPTPPVEPPKTQHRPHGAFAGPLFGTLAGKTASGDIAWDLDVPTLGPALSGTFSASGDFAWGWGLAPSAAAALSATFGASGDFEFFADASPFTLTPTGPVALSATIDAIGDFSASAALASVTVRLVDAPASGAPLPSLTNVQWAWWDDAADESETWGVMPTARGTTESTDGAGSITLEAASSKTSGETVFIKLYQHGYPPRAFSGLLTVS